MCSSDLTEVMNAGFASIFSLEPGIRVRRNLTSRAWVPSLNVVTSTFNFPDEPGRPPAIRHSVFPITPETATSCHYFISTAHNYGTPPASEDILKAQNQALLEIFLTDKLAVEAIQRAYDELGTNTPDCSVRADDAALKFRRLLDGLIAAEAGAGA